jgi:Ca2+-binding EF-hand superfamily protein
MNCSRLLVAAITFTLSGAALAAPPVPSAETPPRDHMARLDSNNDGVVDRAEASRHPRLAEKFDSLDRNHDGRLDAGERPSRHGKRDHRRGMAHVIALDTDGDGRISRGEAAAQPEFAERFAQIDRNRDGYLVRSEVHASAAQRRAEFMTRHRAKSDARFTAADLNRDGKLSRVEVEAAMPRLARAFAFLDEDRDGFLTRADLQREPRR